MNMKNEPELEEQNVHELCGSQRLFSEDVTLESEIEEIDGVLNFYLACWFDVDQVFGTHVETTENDDWINVYANYDRLKSCKLNMPRLNKLRELAGNCKIVN